jgi:hypothetical protein
VLEAPAQRFSQVKGSHPRQLYSRRRENQLRPLEANKTHTCWPSRQAASLCLGKHRLRPTVPTPTELG